VRAVDGAAFAFGLGRRGWGWCGGWVGHIISG
jgi:hypothetical protein